MYMFPAPGVCLWDTVPPMTPTAVMKIKRQPLLRAVPQGTVCLLEVNSFFFFWSNCRLSIKIQNGREHIRGPALPCRYPKQRLTSI